MLFHFLTTYLVLVNALSFILMLADKQKAIKGAWRIPEATLMGTALLGGSIGAICGMYLVRHKTRHIKFTLGIPLILIAQILLALWLVT